MGNPDHIIIKPPLKTLDEQIVNLETHIRMINNQGVNKEHSDTGTPESTKNTTGLESMIKQLKIAKFLELTPEQYANEDVNFAVSNASYNTSTNEPTPEDAIKIKKIVSETK